MRGMAACDKSDIGGLHFRPGRRSRAQSRTVTLLKSPAKLLAHLVSWRGLSLLLDLPDRCGQELGFLSPRPSPPDLS